MFKAFNYLWLKMNHLSLDVRQSRGRWRMHRHVRKNQSFLVVALAQDFVLAQEELVAYTESRNREKWNYFYGVAFR